jgi:hypothetical protein
LCTVIAQVKVYGDENPALTAGYWCCQWRRYYPAATTPSGCTQLAYSVVSTNGIFKRNSKSIAVTVADGKSKYGDENPALTAVVTGAVNGDTINYPSNCHSIL